jgi:hypothetical protein
VKKIGAIFAAALLCAALSACAGTETETLPQTFRSADRRISVSVPEGWSEYAAELKDNMALALQGGGGAFAQVFWYPDVEGKELTALDYTTEAAGYYGDYVTGSAAKVTVADTDDGYYFAYKIEIKDETSAAAEGESAAGGDDATPTATEEPTVLETYQGYEYFIGFAGGVVEVDIFYHYTDTAPTNDELAVLRSIAQTVRIK